MKSKPREPSDKLISDLADQLLIGGKLTVEEIDSRYKHWSGSAWRRLYEHHLQAYEKRHGHALFPG